MRLHDYAASGNCFKVRLLLALLGRPYERVAVDIFAGDTLTDAFAALNPLRETPVLELEDGTTITQSPAILTYLADGTEYLPTDRLTRARVAQWMLFEQNRIEAELSYARFLKLSGRAEQIPEVYENRLRRGEDALVALDRGLSDGREFIAGDYSIADIALYAYVHCADDAGTTLAEHEAIVAWIGRVEATPRFENDLEPLPAHALQRPV